MKRALNASLQPHPVHVRTLPHTETWKLEDSYGFSVPTSGVRQVASVGCVHPPSFFSPRNRCKPHHEPPGADPPLFSTRCFHVCTYVHKHNVEILRDDSQRLPSSISHVVGGEEFFCCKRTPRTLNSHQPQRDLRRCTD